MKVEYLHIAPSQPPPVLQTEPSLVVLISETQTSEEWRNQICDWFVDFGCLYFVSWGIDCEDWHDRVDWTNLEKFDFGEIPNEEFIITTWHSDEPIEDALWFAAHNGFHADVEIARILLAHVSSAAEEARILQAYHRAVQAT